ncbi:MAG: hypothetical protein MMC33_002900 [Icmadophila ericetorum]|nr:hypothetical protein [Icmadophila ericetorum]
MPSIRYYNQTAPFWDWVASMEAAAANSRRAPGGDEREQEPELPPPPPFGAPGFDGPPPPTEDGTAPPPPPPEDGPQRGCPGRRGPPPFARRGGCGGPGVHRFGPHGHGHGPRHGPFGGPRHGGRPGFPFWGSFGGWGEQEGGATPFDLSKLAEMFASQFGYNPETATEEGNKTNGATTDAGISKDFQPPCDVFDLEDSFILHFSLPGAKKEDVGVNWDADKSELSVAGVIYRPGDEDFIKNLALDERNVGAFERKVRLGSRATPALVDADGITARLEDGVLHVRVPKLDSDYVDLKKVDIE